MSCKTIVVKCVCLCVTSIFFYNLNSHIFNQTPKIDIYIYIYKKQNKHVPTCNKTCDIYLVYLKCLNIISYY